MESFLLSFFTVGLAEFGDKSQLITLYLAGLNHRLRHIILGMVMASLLNHYVAAWAGIALEEWIDLNILKIISGCLFIVIGVFSWKHEDAQKMMVFQKPLPPLFLCFLMYFVAEAADKTQFATAALAAYYYSMWMIIGGATLGMVIANFPVIYFGREFGKRFPLERIKKISAIVFVFTGLIMLLLQAV